MISWLVTFAVIVNAQTPTPSSSALSGKSTDIAFIRDKPKPFQYRPVDNLFWERVLKNLKENNPVFILQDSLAQQKGYGAASSEAQESHLAEAMALEKLSFHHAAFTLLTGLAQTRIGTAIGESALFELENISKNNLIDETALENIMVQNEFLQVHPDIQSFIGYYKGLYNLRFGYRKWADPQLSAIKPDSPWRFMMDYWTAIGEVARARYDKAFEALRKLDKEKNLPARLRDLTRLQIARMYFEKGLFAEAEAFYTQIVDLGVREHGRILLERAWTAYYLKDYSRALGLIAALKNPMFDPSISPERFILEMVIYRELCHFDAVEKTGRAFQKRFQHTLEVIRKRKALHEDRTLFYMATLNRDLQNRAILVDEVRKERERFQRAGMQKFFFYEDVLDEYKRRDRVLTAELEPKLESYARRSAENVLDSQEQVQFLQYTAKLDALRLIKPEEDRTYRSERVSHVSFNKIFWPVEKEFWLEELNDYRTLISSRCGNNSTPEDLKLERKFR